MTPTLSVLCLVAAVLFIGSLGGLASQESARRGNLYGMIGMAIALVATMFHDDVKTAGLPLMAVALVIGGVIGAVLAVRVVMTGMPQLVALLHSFVGLAAVLVGISTYMTTAAPATKHPDASHIVHNIEIWLGVAIGAITFTGSVVAWAKLKGWIFGKKVSGSPLLLPGRHGLNAVAVIVLFALAVPFCQGYYPEHTHLLVINAVLAGVLGLHLVLAIGGADMPVVVSLLNSYSGWAAAAAGFMLGNDLLIVTGALVGSSGAILSYIMCEAMNRSIWNVVFGGFGTDGGAPAPSGGQEQQGEVTPIDVDEVAELLRGAKSVVIVPGCGLAVARAQHIANELTQILQAAGTTVRYAIHPVAGRLPGHMNVLLAEAGVPYDIVLEMEEINEDLPETDVVMVIGANDIVNPGAQTDPSSPIYGMPVLEVWKSTDVLVLKRGMGSGYAGVQNPLFFLDNTQMFFGNAKDSLGNLVAALRS